MLLINESKNLSSEILRLKNFGEKINFVPTMGNLHAGHLSLVREAKKDKHICLVSIFVNPLQFNNSNDYKKYPRTEELDRSLLSKEKVDLLYLPNLELVSKDNFTYSLGDISKKLCGIDRKGHFQGVAKVIIKFLRIINPHCIYLGEKDFQQTLIIKKIVKDLNFNTKVVVVPTVRDKNKIALSSRNKILGKKLVLAQLIPSILSQIIKELNNGDFNLSRIDELKESIKKKGIDKVNYLEILKERNLNKPDKIFSYCRVFISVTINSVRLIDNMGIKKKVRLLGEKYFEVN